MPVRNQDESRSVDEDRSSDPTMAATRVPPEGEDGKAGIDVAQSTQILRLNRKVGAAWIAAITGPLIALGGLAFTGLQWNAATDQLVVMRDQLDDARSGAAEARRDTDRAISVAESQAKSLETLAESARNQLGIAQRQAASLAAMAESNRRQIGVAESQGTALQRQTESLASQAESVRVQADASRSEAESMRAVADANRVMSEAASASARAAERLAETAAQQLQATDRPWVNVALSAVDELSFRFDDFRMQMVAITTLTLRIHNTGRSVASAVRFSVRPWIRSPGTPIEPGDLEKAAKERCATDQPTNEASATLFPDETTSMSERSVTPIVPVETSSQTFAATGERQIVEMFAVGCVTYLFSNSSEFHRTWFTYRLERRTQLSGAPVERRSFDVTRPVPAGGVLMSRWPYGGNGAE